MTLPMNPPTIPPPSPRPPEARPLTLQLTATPVFEAASADGADGAPRLPRFRMVAYTGAAMRIAGWRHPVVIDLAGLTIPAQSRPIRFGHDATAGVGHSDAIQVENGQLVATGVVSRDTAAAREVVVSSKNGFPWQASIGASVDEFEFLRESQTAMVNGREHVGPLNVVRKATLAEISFVDLGADGNTSAHVAGQAAGHHPCEQEGETPMTVAAPNTPAPTNGAPIPPVHAGNPPTPATPTMPTPPAIPVNLSATPPASEPTVETIRAQALAETQRIAAVRRICNGQHPDLEAQAIREGWDATRCELEVLRASRPRTPAIHMVDQSVDNRTLEAACLMAARVTDVEESFDAQTLDRARQRFGGELGLQELLLEAAWANGYTGRNFRDTRAVLRYAFNPTLEAGWSAIDIGGILSNVANKFLLEGFFSVERTWRNICAIRTVTDFKTVTSYRLVGKDQYEQVAPGGELKSGTLGEEKYTNKADTYGLVLAIDRRDIINDDLNAITTVPRKLGRGSGLKINDVFWTTFLANGSFFTVGNKNYLAGADTTLTVDGLTKAEVAFLEQVDADGKPVGLMPAIVLVPTALSAAGTQLYKSLEIRDTTASTKYPVNNPHQGKFRVEVSRYLANSQYSGNSAKAWYLLAEPSDMPVIEVAFLNGQEAPTVETAEADFNKLGVQMRGFHDFGAALVEYRGGVKAKGEA